MAIQSSNVLLIAENTGDLQAWFADRPGPRFVFHRADGPAQAVECLAAGGIDLILLDLDLPGGQPFSTLRQVQEKAPGVPVVVLTGDAGEASAIEAARHGAQDCLVKGQLDGPGLGRALSLALARCRRPQADAAARERPRPEASRFAGVLLANASHELRSPLNGIIGFAELMHNGMVGPVSPSHKEYLGDILTCARHLLQLLNDILNLSRIEGEPPCCPEQVDPARCVAAVRDLLRSQAARKQIWIDVRIDPDLGPVVVDPAKLKEVLYSYLSNALTLTPDEGRVTVRLDPEGAEAFRIDVTGAGRGLRPVDVANLFVGPPSPNAGPSNGEAGVGLGLPLAKRLVESQGGRVGGQALPGQGLVFFAVLPRVTGTTPAGCDGRDGKRLDQRPPDNEVSASPDSAPDSRGSPA